MRAFIARLKKIDWLMFSAIIILLAISNSILYSLNLNTDAAGFLVFRKQLIFSFTGLAIFFAFSTINYTFWSTYNKLIYIFFVVILVGVLFFGVEINGTTGWLRVGPFSIQPVEFAKLGVIIWLARYFSEHAGDFHQFKHIFISGLGVLFYVGLVVLQPDLGSALVVFGTWVVVLLFTGIRKRHLLWLLLLFFSVASLAWMFVLQSYQKSRILTFLNPGLDPTGQGYNVIQSIIAVGSGGFFGRGLSLGPQSSLRFLPEPGTDFIFAVIAEDLGLVGVTILLGLFAFIFYRLFLMIRRSQDDFGGYLILGVASMLLVQIFINVGMNMGISPVTGIPLPLVSAGGSSMWAIMMALGITQSIRTRSS